MTDGASQVLKQLLQDSSAGQVRLFVAEDVSDAIAGLNAAGESQSAEVRLLIRIWEHLPPHWEVLDQTLDCLAHLAQAVWPDWYCRPATRGGEAPALAVSDLLERSRLAGLRGAVNEAWLRHAVGRMLAGRPPRGGNAPSAVEAEQLSLAISPLRCVITLIATNASEPAERLLGLVRVSEWIARETSAAVWVLVPAELADSPELDGIGFGRVALRSFACDRLEFASPTTASNDAPRQFQSKTPTEWLATPLIGRPHPYSLGEQMLWAALCRDAELKDLFQCNQWVTTGEATNYLVDLLSKGGKLIVEIDGYYWHSGPDSFARDRHRDFELVLAGYLVLRLPHDEVVASVEGAVEKIRRLVNFRRQQISADRPGSMT